jgi:hypothetical protein
MRLAPTLALAVALTACGPSGEKPDQQSPSQKTCANVAEHVRRDCKKAGKIRQTPSSCENLAGKAETFCNRAREKFDEKTIGIICKALGDSVMQNCDRKGKKSPRKCKTKGEKKEKKCLKGLGLQDTK